jgi:transposase
MTQSLMELSVKEWEERAQAAAANKGDRKKLSAALEDVTKRYRPRREEIYGRYRMTPKEDLRYASDHQPEIADYLDEHADVRDAIDSLKARIDALIEQVESAAAPPAEGAQR